MAELKALEILTKNKELQSSVEPNYLKQAIKELEEFSERFDTLQRYVEELECDCVSLQNDYSNKCKELEELNRSCNKFEVKEI